MGGGLNRFYRYFFIVLYLTLRYKICYILKMHILETHGVLTSIHPIFFIRAIYCVANPTESSSTYTSICRVQP